MGVRARVAADERSDAELAIDAAAGDQGAFEALYRRHSETAWRVAYAVTGNREDASDAVADAFARVLQALPAGRLENAAVVRSYLLTATRNAAIDHARRGGRVRATDEIDLLDDRTKLSASPTEVVSDSEDASFVARAFRSLPERWRSVLWLVEVEGMAPKDAAELLGVTPNNAAQLAVRARAGLRERFVQAHLSGRVADECRFTVERLGAYVTGRLAPRELAKVDQHLAACADCRERNDELAHVGSTLRHAVLPIPLLLGPASVAKWKLISSVGPAAHAAGTAKAGAWWTEFAARAHKPVAAAATGIFAIGVIVAAPHVLGSPERGRPTITANRPPVMQNAQAPNAAVVPQQSFRLVSNQPFTVPDTFDDAVALDVDALAQPEAAPPAADVPPAAPPSGGFTNAPPPGDGDGDGGDGPTEPANEVELGFAALAGPVSAGFVAGDECQGGYVSSESMGCEAPTTDASTVGVTVNAVGPGPVGDRSQTLGI